MMKILSADYIPFQLCFQVIEKQNIQACTACNTHPSPAPIHKRKTQFLSSDTVDKGQDISSVSQQHAIHQGF